MRQVSEGSKFSNQFLRTLRDEARGMGILLGRFRHLAAELHCVVRLATSKAIDRFWEEWRMRLRGFHIFDPVLVVRHIV